jgi:hypothetical protein
MHAPLISGSAVRKLWVGESELYRQHLLRLDADSRRNRFGGAVSDEFIERYAEPSGLGDAVIYGFFVDGIVAAPRSCACSNVRVKPRRR